MYTFWDYSTILHHFFLQHQAITTVYYESLAQKRLIIDSCFLLKNKNQQTENSILKKMQKIDNKIKSQKKVLVFAGKFFSGTKKEIVNHFDLKNYLLQINTLNNYQSKILQSSKFFFPSENCFLRNFLQHKYYRYLLVKASQNNYTTVRAPSKKEYQISYLFDQNQKQFLFGEPVIFFTNFNVTQIGYQLKKNAAKAYDLSILSAILNISEQQLRILFFWGFIIYSSNQNNNETSILNQVLGFDQQNLKNNYKILVQEKLEYFSYVFLQLQQINNLSLNAVFIDLIANYFELPREDVMKQYLVFVQDLVYDQKQKRLLILQLSPYLKQQQINPFLSLKGESLIYKNFIPEVFQNFQNWKKNQLSIRGQTWFNQSKEMIFQQSYGNFCFNKTILKNIIFSCFKKTPKKIIIKQLAGHQFFNNLKPSLMIVNAHFDHLLPPSLKNALLLFQNFDSKSCKFNNYQILNLSLFQFLQQIKIILDNGLKKHKQFQFFTNMSEFDYLEQALVIIELQKQDFLNKENFILPNCEQKNNRQTFQRTKYQKLSSMDYFVFKSENFSTDFLYFLENIETLYKQISSRCYQALIQKNLLQNKFQIEENLHLIIFQISLIIQKYYKTPKEKIWKLILNKIYDNYEDINFCGLFYMILGKPLNSYDQTDHRCLAQSSVIDQIKESYFSLILSNLAVCVKKFEVPGKQSEREYFQYLPFCQITDANTGTFVKEIVTLIFIGGFVQNNFQKAQSEILERVQKCLSDCKFENIKFLEKLSEFLEKIISSFQIIENLDFQTKKLSKRLEQVLKFLESIISTYEDLKSKGLQQLINN